MKFENRKGIGYSVIILGLNTLLIGSAVGVIATGEMEPHEYWILIPLLVLVGFFFWMYFGTNYELTDTTFIYRSGPFNGKIKIARITEITKTHTPWIGLKYATAKKGLKLKFDTYGEIFISPKADDLFLKKIRALHSGIKITNGKA